MSRSYIPPLSLSACMASRGAALILVRTRVLLLFKMSPPVYQATQFTIFSPPLALSNANFSASMHNISIWWHVRPKLIFMYTTKADLSEVDDPCVSGVSASVCVMTSSWRILTHMAGQQTVDSSLSHDNRSTDGDLGSLRIPHSVLSARKTHVPHVKCPLLSDSNQN